MRPRSSLRTRIFVATTLVAVVSLGSALHFMDARIEREGEAELRRELTEAADLAEQHHARRLETLILVARLIADLSKLKAAVETHDKPTIAPIADEYLTQAHADAIVVTGPHGETLAARGIEEADAETVRQALSGRTVVETRTEESRLLELVTVPVTVGRGSVETLGTLALGLSVNRAFADEIKRVTASDVAFVSQGSVVGLTSDLPADRILAAAAESEPTLVRHEGQEYIALGRVLSASGARPPRPTVVLLRSPTERLRFLRAMRAGLAGAGVAAVTFAVLLSYLVARSVTRPLTSIAATMREMTASGDLTREVPSGGGWDDEDARVLATAFRALTDSIRRFQREAALKERLSALGRMSTVVAHEVRNPLMIIKGSLRLLARPVVGDDERREAVADIDQEVNRLDRIVKDVLEYARPVSVTRAPVDLGAVLRDAAHAVPREGDPVRIEMEDGLSEVSTDVERLRSVLVNLLTNARDAVAVRGAALEAGEASVILRAFRRGAAVVMEVEDRGTGIAPEALTHVFEPYFTTKRTGSGLGLAIARNIVESLGGTISAESRSGQGTTVRIELPGTA